MRTNIQLDNRYVADGLLLSVAFIWGTTFALVKEAIENVDVFVFLSQRFLLSGIFLGIICYAKRGIFNYTVLKQGFVLGLFLFGAFAFQTIGLKFTTASNAAFITGLNVVLVPICELIICKKRVGAHIWIGVTLAIVGLFLLTTNGEMYLNSGDIIVLGCAVCVALQVVFTDIYTRKTDILWLTTIELMTVGLISTAITVLTGKEVLHYYSGTGYALIVCVFFATIFAFLIQTSVQRYTSSSHVAIMLCMEPVFASVFAYFYARELLGTWGIVGGILVLFAMLVSELGIKWFYPESLQSSMRSILTRSRN